MTETPEIRCAASVLRGAASDYSIETIRREINTASSIGGIFLAAGLSDEAKDEVREAVRGFILRILEGATPQGAEQISADIKTSLADHAADYVRAEVLGQNYE